MDVMLAMLLHKWCSNKNNKKAHAHCLAPWQYVKHVSSFGALAETRPVKILIRMSLVSTIKHRILAAQAQTGHG